MEKNKKKILIGSVSGIAAAVLLTGIIVAAVQGSGKAFCEHVEPLIGNA